MHMQLLRQPLVQLAGPAMFPRLYQLQAPKAWISAIPGYALENSTATGKPTSPAPSIVTLRSLGFRAHSRTSAIDILKRFRSQLRDTRVEGVNIATPDDLQVMTRLAPGLKRIDLPEVVVYNAPLALAQGHHLSSGEYTTTLEGSVSELTSLHANAHPRSVSDHTHLFSSPPSAWAGTSARGFNASTHLASSAQRIP